MIEPIFRAKEFPDFTVDRTHSVLLNTNLGKLKAYKNERERIQKSKLNNDRLNKVEQELFEIKQLLRELVHGSK